MDKRIIEETPSTELLNDDWLIKDSPTGGTSKILGSKLKEIISGDVEDSIDKILDSIAPEWSSTFTYGFDAYVIHEGELWRCFKDTGSTVGEFKTSEWIKAVTSGYITHVVNKIADRFVASNPPFMTYRYSVGDMVFYSEPYHDEQLYVCNTDLPQGESTFNPEHWDVVYTVAGLSKYLMDKIAEAGQIDDVQVKTTGDYESVVDNKVAKIDLSNILIEKSVPNLPQSVATFNDGSDLPLKSLTASIVPVQDLHGYDSPWAGGAGKNKLPMTVDGIKSANTSGTWSGNSYVLNGVTFTIQTDSGGNVIGIDAHGLASANATLDLNPSVNFNASIVMTGCPSGGSDSTYEMLTTSGNHRDRGTGAEWTWDTNNVVRIVIRNGYNASHVVFNPMIRLASVADATFAPYSNICPISGWTEEVVSVRGSNLIDITSFTPTYALNGITYTINSDGSVVANGTATSRSQVYWSIPQDVAKTFTNKKLSGLKTHEGCSLFLELNGSPYTNYGTDTGEGTNIDSSIENANTAVNLVIRITSGTTVSNYVVIPRITDELQTYTIPFQDSQGNPIEVFGGSVDVVNGADNKRTLGSVDLEELEWVYDANIRCWNINIQAEWNMKGVSNNQQVANATAEQFKLRKASGMSSSVAGELAVDVSMLRANTGSDNESPKGLLVYELATPTTFYTQPTSIKSLDGENNVFASTGDVTKLEYIANATDVIANLEARVTALENQ